MNNHNLKKRRPYGHEDAPVVPLSQDPPLSSVSVGPPQPEAFSDYELHIIQQAASILNCQVPQLLVLDRDSRVQQYPPRHYHPHYHHPPPPQQQQQQHHHHHHHHHHHQQQQQQQQQQHQQHQQQHSASPVSYAPSNKRQRLSTDLTPMSPHEKSLAPGQTTDQPRRPETSNNGFSLGIERSRLAHYFANISVCTPCTTCEPQGYAGIPPTSSYDYPQPRPYLDHKSSSPPNALPGNMSPDQPNLFVRDESAVAPPVMPNYPVLTPHRPMTIQPTTSGEGMVYPESTPGYRYLAQPEAQHSSPNSTRSHVMRSDTYSTSPLESPKETTRRYSTAQTRLSSDMDGAQAAARPHDLDIVHSNQRPPPARRGPFRSNDDREKTAETRRIGSCIRCRMQRIRCEINPVDKHGSCLTCQRVSNVKVWRMPCLRYKITDVKLFKPGQVKGYEWTRRWVEGIADDISQWASSDIRTVRVTEGYTDQPIGLRVRKFVPQEGDALERTWVHDGVRRKVSIPAYAIVNLDEAKGAYSNYISQGIFECCKNVLSGKEKLLMATYIAAIKAAGDPSIDEKERGLMRKALQLWMAVRMTTKSTIIVGEETLGMSHDIMDETSPLRGCIPLPPVMGAQIELVLIHQIQSSLRREMLENLQAMTHANKHQTWYTTYLITFILLHNVALLCQHDAGYARKHGIKNRFAREDMVREYQMGANILLAYFHYCNKGIYPFSAECKEQDLTTLAELDEAKTHFIKLTRTNVEKHKKQWEKMRQSNDYENDFYYTSQLYEENWMPQPTI